MDGIKQEKRNGKGLRMKLGSTVSRAQKNIGQVVKKEESNVALK